MTDLPAFALLVASLVAGFAIYVARDVAVRWFADRADARVKRVAEAERAAAAAAAAAAEHDKRLGALERTVAATLTGRQRR